MWKGFQRPKRLATDMDTITDRYGRFHAQPFEHGFGTTIGNALRRVLLSSIEGAAITAVKIEGVLHEFQSIPGVVEDATDLIEFIRCTPETPRVCGVSKETISEIRAKIDKHIKNSYLKKVQAPIGVKPALTAWMELS